jgi:hypothetical protein
MGKNFENYQLAKPGNLFAVWMIERRRLGLIISIAEQIHFVSSMVIKPSHLDDGRVAELVYATDLKSVDQKSCGFKSHLAHHVRVNCYPAEILVNK